MPIVVDHSGNLPSLTAAISLLLAQKQQQDQQQAQQGSVQDALSQLAPILAARHAAENQAPPGYAIPQGLPVDQSAQHPDQPRYVRPTIQQQGADHSASVLRGILNGDQTNNRLNNQDALAQYKAQQSDQRLGERSQNQNDLEQLRDADMRVRAAQHDLPQSVVQGLQSGHMAYTPIQKDQLGKFDTWDAQLDNDPTFSPAERARAHADIAMRRRQVLISPTLLPPDQWPITPQQQADQSSWTETDPVTRLTVRYHAGGVRNGVQQPPKLDEISAAHLKDWQSQQTSQRKLAQIAASAANKHDTQAFREQEADAKHNAAYVAEQRARALERLGPAPNPKSFSKLGGRLDQGAYDAAMKDWQTKRDAVDQQFSVNDQFAPFVAKRMQQLNNIGAEMGGMSMLPIPGGPQVTGVDYGDGSLSSAPADSAASQPAPGPGQNDAMQLPPPENPPGVDGGDSEAAQSSSPQQLQPLSITSPSELALHYQSGNISLGDTVLTPLGPRQVTSDIIDKLA